VHDPSRRLVAGLGNPGPEYRHTRHNAGFLLIDRLAAAFGIALMVRRALPNLLWGSGVAGGSTLALAKPMAYMNRSGPPLSRLADELGLYGDAVLIVHDDIDLEFGKIKIKEKGGHGGHRGILSLIDAFGRNDFVRLRIGIGRPPAGTTAVEHVLSGFSEQEVPVFDAVLDRAREAVMAILRDGVSTAMNRFNGKEGQIHLVNS
jgi:PTH1 family peptidyl-tRNA hydrolase